MVALEAQTRAPVAWAALEGAAAELEASAAQTLASIKMPAPVVPAALGASAEGPELVVAVLAAAPLQTSSSSAATPAHDG